MRKFESKQALRIKEPQTINYKPQTQSYIQERKTQPKRPIKKLFRRLGSNFYGNFERYAS
jgi:hypothetical protein